MLFSRLAHYILKGRIQAVIVALLGSAVLFLTQISISLVALKKGYKEGFLVTLWALLPVIVLAAAGRSQLLVVFISIASVASCFIAASVLRFTISWPQTLMAIVITSIVFAVISLFLVGDLGAHYQEFVESMARRQQEVASDTPFVFKQWPQQQFAGFFALFLSLGTLIGLVISRWMHAMVSNPGGFKQEFHALRLNAAVTLVSVGLTALFTFLGDGYQSWAALCCLPLFVSGIGLLHWIVSKKKFGKGAIAALYFILVIFYPLIYFITFLGILDTWVNFREKFH